MTQPARKSEDLLEKIRELSPDKLAEVEDFIDFLREKQRRTANTPEERLRIAAEAGLITPPEPGHKRSSISEAPPVSVPGRPMSEIALEDRR
jgi:hypothetical protein